MTQPAHPSWLYQFEVVAKKLNLREETVSGVDEYGMIKNLVSFSVKEAVGKERYRIAMLVLAEMEDAYSKKESTERFMRINYLIVNPVEETK